MSRLRVLFVCVFLELGVLAGSPVRPDEIRELMQQLQQPKVVHVLSAESESGDDPL
jgi:hypothetical protein